MRWLRIKTAGDALAVEPQDELPQLVQPEVDGESLVTGLGPTQVSTAISHCIRDKPIAGRVIRVCVLRLQGPSEFAVSSSILQLAEWVAKNLADA
jgi:hypothetical protein